MRSVLTPSSPRHRDHYSVFSLDNALKSEFLNTANDFKYFKRVGDLGHGR